MFYKTIYLILVCLICFHLPNEVHASPPNVIECMEGDVDCEELEIQDNNLNKENNDLLVETSRSGSLILDFIKLFLALILVLALIYIALKVVGNKSKITARGKVLENMAGLPLGQNKSLQIIRIGSKFYLIGVGENVQLLDEISDEELISELLEQTKENGSDSSSFIRSFMFSGINESNKRDFKKLFSNELEKLKRNRSELIKQREDKHE